LVGTDGVVMVEAAVTGTDASFGGMHIDPDRLDLLVGGAPQVGGGGVGFAAGVWQRIDRHADVQQAAVALAITNANGRVYGRPLGNTMSFGRSHQLPHTIVVPQPAALVRRGDVTGTELRERVLAATRRVFADAGAVSGG